MKRTLTTLAVLACVLSIAHAEATKPVLPKAPAGFDEGRDTLLIDAKESRLKAWRLPKRLFEHAGITEVARFFQTRLNAEERKGVDDRLGFEGRLTACTDVASTRDLLKKKEKSAEDFGKALGDTLQASDMTLPDACVWMYLHGYNWRALQNALDGFRSDPLRAMASVEDQDCDNVTCFNVAFWELNSNDARTQSGGHYNGVQLVRAARVLGWTEADYETAIQNAGSKMTEARRTAIAWGDDRMIWAQIKNGLVEADFRDALRIWVKDRDATDIRTRCATFLRGYLDWFRTEGPGVEGVYSGPWPNAKGEPKPPELAVEEPGAETTTEWATKELSAHFDATGLSLRWVWYTDGSARAMLIDPSRTRTEALDAPFPTNPHVVALYEGRFSTRAKSVYVKRLWGELGPESIELINTTRMADDALIRGDHDDGTHLTPVIFRRTR